MIGVDVGGADLSEERLLEICEGKNLCIYHTCPKPKHIESVLCSQAITMDDRPLAAIRQKKDSTLVRALQDLQSGKISALVTCAHTGAVTSASVIHLKRFSGLRYPGLLAVLPSEVTVLDVGAFITATASDLFHYLCLGSSFAKIAFGLSSPRVGLLNIGRESGKGTDELKELDQWLLQHPTDRWHYVGNVEPLAVFSHEVDVVVTSGFVGNIFLKTAEGMAQVFSSHSCHHYGGALLAGVKGIVIKSHGASSKEAFVASLRQAEKCAQMNITQRLESEYHNFSSDPNCHPNLV